MAAVTPYSRSKAVPALLALLGVLLVVLRGVPPYPCRPAYAVSGLQRSWCAVRMPASLWLLGLCRCFAVHSGKGPCSTLQSASQGACQARKPGLG